MRKLVGNNTDAERRSKNASVATAAAASQTQLPSNSSAALRVRSDRKVYSKSANSNNNGKNNIIVVTHAHTPCTDSVAYVRRVWTVEMKLKTISETVNKDELFKKVNRQKKTSRRLSRLCVFLSRAYHVVMHPLAL